MSKIKTILRGGALAAILTVVIAAPTFAAPCREGAQHGDYEGLSIGNQDGTGDADADAGSYPIRCPGTVKVGDADRPIYGKTSAACALAGSLSANPDGCEGEGRDLDETFLVIINMVIFFTTGPIGHFMVDLLNGIW